MFDIKGFLKTKTEIKKIFSKIKKNKHIVCSCGSGVAACNIALGIPDQAEAPLNKAIRLDSKFSSAWHNRGLLYLEWGEEDAAIQDFETTIKVDPKHIDARLHLASIHHSAGRWKIAAPLWRDVLDIDSDNDVARQRLSHCEMQITATTK